MLGTMSQLINFMEVEYLPAYYPSAEEKKDPKLYAANVKQMMVMASGLPSSNEGYEDKVAWEKRVGYESKETRKRNKQKNK